MSPLLISTISCLAGLFLLVLGGEWLIRGSVGIAQRLRLTPMIIGLTVVSFGTSAPEFIVSLQSAINGNSGIALGNVIGSNIVNIALILGVTALLLPIPVQGSTLKIDTPLLIVSSIVLTLLCHFTGTLTRMEGIVGFAVLIAYITLQIRKSRTGDTGTDPDASPATAAPPMLKSVIFIAVAIVALKYGAENLVGGASAIARSMGVSDRVIGLTVVAIGTSLPELFASVIAARKGNTDMAVGNVIGSNLFNILCVLAASCAITPISGIEPAFTSDCLWMIALTLIIWVQMRTGHRLTRIEGAVLLAIYAFYLTLTVTQ